MYIYIYHLARALQKRSSLKIKYNIIIFEREGDETYHNFLSAKTFTEVCLLLDWRKFVFAWTLVPTNEETAKAILLNGVMRVLIWRSGLPLFLFPTRRDYCLILIIASKSAGAGKHQEQAPSPRRTSSSVTLNLSSSLKTSIKITSSHEKRRCLRKK